MNTETSTKTSSWQATLITMVLLAVVISGAAYFLIDLFRGYADAKLQQKLRPYNAYPGLYLREGSNMYPFAVSEEDGSLRFHVAGEIRDLYPIDDAIYGIADSDYRVKFNLDEAGFYSSITVMGDKQETATKNSYWGPQPGVLEEAVGEYYSPEYDRVVALKLEGERLVMSYPWQDDVELMPTVQHAFTAAHTFAEVRLEYDQAGRLNGLRIHNEDHEQAFFAKQHID